MLCRALKSAGLRLEARMQQQRSQSASAIRDVEVAAWLGRNYVEVAMARQNAFAGAGALSLQVSM